MSVVLAKIGLAIDQDFRGRTLGRPTDKQIALAWEFGYSIENEST